MAEAFLQRLGVASDQLLYFLDMQESHCLITRERLLEAIADENVTAAEEYFAEYRRITQGKSTLHEQFLLLSECVSEWNLYLSGKQKQEREKTLADLEDKLLAAWKITREPYDIAGNCPKFLGFQELKKNKFF